MLIWINRANIKMLDSVNQTFQIIIKFSMVKSLRLRHGNSQQCFCELFTLISFSCVLIWTAVGNRFNNFGNFDIQVLINTKKNGWRLNNSLSLSAAFLIFIRSGGVIVKYIQTHLLYEILKRLRWLCAVKFSPNLLQKLSALL